MLPLQAYLTDKEFADVFKMPREEFKAHKKWKQVAVKKAVNLF